MKLIDDVSKAWKFVSIQIQGAVIALAGGWALMPQEWKDATPKWAMVACAATFAFATIAGRVVAQKAPPQ